VRPDRTFRSGFGERTCGGFGSTTVDVIESRPAKAGAAVITFSSRPADEMICQPFRRAPVKRVVAESRPGTPAAAPADTPRRGGRLGGRPVPCRRARRLRRPTG